MQSTEFGLIQIGMGGSMPGRRKCGKFTCKYFSQYSKYLMYDAPIGLSSILNKKNIFWLSNFRLAMRFENPLDWLDVGVHRCNAHVIIGNISMASSIETNIRLYDFNRATTIHHISKRFRNSAPQKAAEKIHAVCI